MRGKKAIYTVELGFYIEIIELLWIRRANYKN